MNKTEHMTVEILDASFHRNGVGGVGFHAIIFKYQEDGKTYGPMIASLFDEPGYCAVYSIEKLQEKNIAFARGNSFRGDVFEDLLRPALKKFTNINGTNRIGPFAL
jgi:lipopolysaccharide biosynthesis protein